MANIGRYSYNPMAGKIRGNKRSLKDKFLLWKRRRDGLPDMYTVVNYGQAYIPGGYKK